MSLSIVARSSVVSELSSRLCLVCPRCVRLGGALEVLGRKLVDESPRRDLIVQPNDVAGTRVEDSPCDVNSTRSDL